MARNTSKTFSSTDTLIALKLGFSIEDSGLSKFVQMVTIGSH